MLFGGTPSEYVISTIDSNPADVNGMTWISTWGGGAYCTGFPCGGQVADNFAQSTGGLYATYGDTSAYVTDWAVGSQFTNYAFLAAPEPATWASLMLGLFGVGALLRQRRRSTLAAASV